MALNRSCPNIESLEQFVQGKASESKHEAMTAHIAGCPQCKRLVDEIKLNQEFISPPQDDSFVDPFDASTHAHSTGTHSSGRNLPHIEGYEINHEIGRGGMGVVYAAIEKELSREVALKFLPALAEVIQPELITRFKREAKAAARLHHTNIVPIYNFGQSPAGLYYAMELIHGRSLREVLRELAGTTTKNVSVLALAAAVNQSGLQLSAQEESIDEGSSSGATSGASASSGRAYYDQVARWICDVASALQYAHQNGIIHRDIKPGNLLLSNDGRLMITDFGLAKSVGDESVTVSGSLVGTYRYMSPEQISAKRVRMDARTDIYSLGVTLYEMLTLQPCFQSERREELFSQILFRVPLAPRRVNGQIPRDLETICLKAMEKASSDRYATAEEMADDLHRYLNDRPIIAKPPNVLVVGLKFVRRNRYKVTAMCTALLLVLAIGLWRNSESRSEAATIEHYLELGEYAKVLEIEPDHLGALDGIAKKLKDEYNTQFKDEHKYNKANANKLVRALGYIEHAIDLKPQGFDYWNTKGVLLKMMGRYSESVDTLQHALQLIPDEKPAWEGAQIHINLVQSDVLAGDLASATTHLDSILQAFPSELTADQCSEKELSPEEFVKKKAALACCKWYALRHEASLLMAKGFPSDALKAIKLATEEYEAYTSLDSSKNATDEERVDNVSLRIRALLQLGRWEMAIPDAYYADRARAQGDSRIKRLLAKALLETRQFDRAEKAAMAAIELGDIESPNHLVLAAISLERGKLDEARDHLQAAESNLAPALLDSDGFTVDSKRGLLWFETAREWREWAAPIKSALEK